MGTSSSKEQTQQSICLPFHVAIQTIPAFMQGNDETEKHELAMFFNLVDHLHKPGDNNISVRKTFDYFLQIFPAETDEAASKRSLPQGFDELFDITGNIASEIACKVINGVDLHKITIEVLNILQQFSWETKVALTATTYTLTFGDSGLNLCSESKMSIKDIPIFLKHLLEIMNCLVKFEKLPTTYMTSSNFEVKGARTHFIVAVYWITRAIVATSASRILRISSRGGGFDMDSSKSWAEKLEAITVHLGEKLHELEELQGDEVDNEAHKKIKEIVQKKDNSDNIKVLNALLSPTDYDTPQLYNEFSKRLVRVNELKEKNVLLLISSLDINSYEHDTIKMIYNESNKKFEFEMVWIPIIDDPPESTDDVDSLFEKLRTSIPWYCVYHPSTIRNAVRKIFIEDWKFEGEPIIVVLDTKGNVVNKNAMHMMLVWQTKAIPFTSTREKTLCEQETWSLELLINGIDEQVMDWIHNEKFIFMYGGVNMEWIRSFIRMVKNVAQVLTVPIHMVYVGKNDDDPNLLEKVVTDIKVEKLSHCLSNYSMWHFWRRKNSIMNSMIQHEKFDNIVFSQILKFDKHTKSKAGWAIFAKGSTILVNGHGKVMLSTLESFNHLKDKVPSIGLEEQFERKYKELYLKKFPIQRLDFQKTSNGKKPDYIHCPDCQREMQKTKIITFHCDHRTVDTDDDSQTEEHKKDDQSLCVIL